MVTIFRVPAVTLVVPAFPDPDVLLAISPLLRYKVPALTATVPAFPDPNVLLEIWPPLTIDRAAALTVTSPPLPMVPGPVAVWIPDPSIDRGPEMLTVTLPAFPVLAGAPFRGPSALLEILPLTIDKLPAVTFI